MPHKTKEEILSQYDLGLDSDQYSDILDAMDEYTAHLRQENAELRKAMNDIMACCDNENDTHEVIWHMAHKASLI